MQAEYTRKVAYVASLRARPTRTGSVRRRSTTSEPLIPDRSTNQNTTEKNTWLSCGTSSTTSRIKKPQRLDRFQRALGLRLEVRFQRAVAVQAGNRQQVQQHAR